MAKWNLIQRSLVLSSFGRLDAEYYHPTNLQAYTKVVNHNHTFVRDIAKEGYRVVYENTKLISQTLATLDMPLFVQATNINAADGEIEFASCGCTVASDWDNYPKGRIKRGELLIEVKGQAEKVTIVPDYAPENALISGSLFKLEVDEQKISPWFVYIYFCTKYGRTLRDRVKTNTLIGFVSKPQLYAIPIVVPKANFQAEIEKMVKDSFLQRRKSRELYSFACSLLASALKINELKFNRPLSYTTKFSDVLHARRADAEYYQPKYDDLFERIESFENSRLRDIVNIKKSIEPGSDAYQVAGIPFVRISDISKFGITPPEIHLDRMAYYSENLTPKKDTILLSKDGSVGIAYKVEEDLDVITSGALLHLTITDDNFLPDYLTLVLNSIIVKLQAERDAGGSIIQHWKPSEIENVIVPKLPMPMQEQIAAKVQESFALRKESKHLLDLAKHAVEIAIEQGEDAAMKLLGENV